MNRYEPSEVQCAFCVPRLPLQRQKSSFRTKRSRGLREQHSPKEVSLVSCAIQGGGQQQLRVLGLLGPQCPQPHGSRDKEHGEDDLGDEAAHVAPGVVEPLDEQG